VPQPSAPVFNSTVPTSVSKRKVVEKKFYAPAPSGSAQVRPIKTEDRIAAEMQAERLIGHAQSALRFHDVDTAIEKMKTALGYLLPYEGQGDYEE